MASNNPRVVSVRFRKQRFVKFDSIAVRFSDGQELYVSWVEDLGVFGIWRQSPDFPMAFGWNECPKSLWDTLTGMAMVYR